MIYIDAVTINGSEFTHTWSDTFTIMRDGVEYYEAYDPAEFVRVYEETQNLRHEDITNDEFLSMLEEVL